MFLIVNLIYTYSNTLLYASFLLQYGQNSASFDATLTVLKIVAKLKSSCFGYEVSGKQKN